MTIKSLVMTRILQITFVLFIYAFVSEAQKLPGLQKEGVRAPAQIIIDGKLKEWGGSLQAHNNIANISYTMANDADNLYLVVQAVESTDDVVNKILRGGITLAIQKAGRRDDKDAVAITYPVSTYPFSIIFRRQQDTTEQTVRERLEKANQLVEQNIKAIKVKGIAGVDTMISIYNEHGIKAAGLYAASRIYNMELCIPLKYLGLSADSEPRFAYHITLNGYKRPPSFGPMRNMDGTLATSAVAERLMADAAAWDAELSAKTDFWGEYTLAKKP